MQYIKISWSGDPELAVFRDCYNERQVSLEQIEQFEADYDNWRTTGKPLAGKLSIKNSDRDLQDTRTRWNFADICQLVVYDTKEK